MTHLYCEPLALIQSQLLTPSPTVFPHPQLAKAQLGGNLTPYLFHPCSRLKPTTSGEKHAAAMNTVKLTITSRTLSGALLLSGHHNTVESPCSFSSRLLFHAPSFLLRPPAPSFPSSLSAIDFAWYFPDVTAAVGREFPNLPAPTLPTAYSCVFILCLLSCAWRHNLKPLIQGKP